MTTILAAAAMLLAAPVFATPAWADDAGGFAPPPPAKVSPYRQGRGWFLSGDVGLAMVSYGQNGESAGEVGAYVVARFGGMLTPRLALSAEFWSDGHGYRDFEAGSATQNTLALAATFWLTPRFWLSGGLGSSTAKGFWNGSVEWEEEGISLMIGVAYELLHRPRWSIDLTSRVVTTWYEPFHRTATIFGVGASWH